MGKFCSIDYGIRCHGSNGVSIWPPIGVKLRLFLKTLFCFTESFVSILVIDWTSLRKSYQVDLFKGNKMPDRH